MAEELRLPAVVTPLSEGEVLERARTASRRGRLAGFAEGGEGLFTVAAFGQPFDRTIIVRPSVGEGGEGGGTRLSFESRLKLRLPIVFALALLITVEPGRYFLDTLIPGEWGWIDTRIWYYPLAIIPIPFMWRGWVRKSRSAAHEHGLEQVEKIAGEVQGRVERA